MHMARNNKLCRFLQRVFLPESTDTLLAYIALVFVGWQYSWQYTQVNGVLDFINNIFEWAITRQWHSTILIRHGTVMETVFSWVYWLLFVWLIVLGIRLLHSGRKNETQDARRVTREEGTAKAINEINISLRKLDKLDDIISAIHNLAEQIKLDREGRNGQCANYKPTDKPKS